MKTTQIIKKLLIISAASLTLASCGGGGGGGGESSSGSSNNNSTDNTVQQETYSAPESLSSGMEFNMTSAETGKVTKFIITSPTSFVDGSGASATVEYTKTGDKTCSISYKYDSSPMITLGQKFVFTSANGGDYYHGEKKMGTFTFATSSNSDSSSDDNYDNEPDEPTVADYAPAALPIGKVLKFSHGSSTVYQYKIVSEEAVIVEGATYSAKYTKSGKNTATLKVNISGMERIWELTFRDEESGNAQYNSQGTVYDEYTFRLTADSGSEPPSDDTDSDDNITDDDDANNSDDNDTPEVEYAPSDLNAYEFHYISSSGGMAFFFVNNEYNRNVIVRYSPDSSWSEIGKYVYTKTGKSTATLSYSVSEMNGGWNSETQGALSLTFNANGTVSVSGSTIDTTIPGGQTNTYTINATYRVKLDQD